MGACVSNTSEVGESEIFTDLEWSHQTEEMCEFIDSDIVPSRVKFEHSTRTFDKGNKKISSPTEFLETTRGTHLHPNVSFYEETGSTSVSQSNNSLEIISFSSSSSLSSPSSSWRDSVDLMSYDGINERVCNRNDIGLRMIKAQIKCGADPNVWTTHGDRSCLMFAVLAGDFNFIKQLIGLGVDVNKTNRSGETALTLAVSLGREDIASYLRSNGAVGGTHDNDE